MNKIHFSFSSRILTTMLLVSILLNIGYLTAQINIVQGIVTDHQGRLLSGIKISDTASRSSVYTNKTGEFTLEIYCTDSCDLFASGPGYIPKLVRVAPQQHITVILEYQDSPRYYPSDFKDANRPAIGFNFWFGGDFRDFNFGSFEPSLGSYNVKVLNSVQSMIAFRLGFDIKNIYLALDFGFGGFGESAEDDFPDSLKYEVSQTMYGLHVGYHLVNSRHMLITPLTGLKLYRSRLVQSVSEDKIDLDQYLDAPSLDIRFNQLTWFAGLMVQYKFKDDVMTGWVIGAYVGYLGRVNSDVWVRSTRNRLNTDNSTEVGPVNFGITLGVYMK